MRDAILSFVGESGWQIELYLHEQFPATQGHKPLDSWMDRLAKSASTDCGKDWISPEKSRLLVEALTRLFRAAQYVCAHRYEDGTPAGTRITAVNDLRDAAIEADKTLAAVKGQA